MPYADPPSDSEIAVAKGIRASHLRRIRDFGRAFLPDCVDTDELDAGKVLKPDGSGGAAWGTAFDVRWSNTIVSDAITLPPIMSGMWEFSGGALFSSGDQRLHFRGLLDVGNNLFQQLETTSMTITYSEGSSSSTTSSDVFQALASISLLSGSITWTPSTHLLSLQGTYSLSLGSLRAVRVG